MPTNKPFCKACCPLLAVMRSFTLSLLVCFLLFSFLLELSESARGRTRSKNRSTGQTTKNKSSGKGSSGSKTNKDKRMIPTSKTSPVLVSQTIQGSRRSNVLRKAVVVYLGLRTYGYVDALVYRGGYPMFRSGFFRIPEERAVRITFEEERLLYANGTSCLGNETANFTLRGVIDKEVIDNITIVKYESTGENKTYQGDTVSLEDIENQDFEVRSLARYNTFILNGTSCTKVEKIVRGTMVLMYETHPNAAIILQVNNQLIVLAFALFAISPVVKFAYY